MDSSPHHLRAILYAFLGFALWVVADSCMKLAGEADLPGYEVVGFLGFFALFFLVLDHARRGRIKDLYPQRPRRLVLRALLAFGCMMANAVALKHLPLTLFYLAVFTAPMAIAMLASLSLREHLTRPKILAIVAGFGGVVIAIAPWDAAVGGDWIGYVAASLGVLLFAAMTVWLRVMAQTETPQSIIFFTALVETVLGFGFTAWHAAPVSFGLLLILMLMGGVNVVGNLLNCMALRAVSAATVEQFHYTQLAIGAAIGYVIWHEVPTRSMMVGAAVIIAAGLYVAASPTRAVKLAASADS